MAAILTGDSGTKSIPTARAYVFGAGMPASTTAADYGVATSTSARANVWQPAGVDNSAVAVTNPPSATSDIGSN